MLKRLFTPYTAPVLGAAKNPKSSNLFFKKRDWGLAYQQKPCSSNFRRISIV